MATTRKRTAVLSSSPTISSRARGQTRRRSPSPGRSCAPPRGRLFQEDLRAEPFWLLVACGLVNLTSWEQAEPAFKELRLRWPTPKLLLKAHHMTLKRIMRPLGLWRIRAKRLVTMAKAWTTRVPRTASDVLDFPGCGLYASQSWSIFIEGHLLDPATVTDHKLGWFLQAVTSGAKERPDPRLSQEARGRAEGVLQ